VLSEIVSDPASLRAGGTTPSFKRVLAVRAYTCLLIDDQDQNRFEHQATVANYLAVAGWQVNRWLDDITRLVPVEDPEGDLPGRDAAPTGEGGGGGGEESTQGQARPAAAAAAAASG